MNYHLQQNTIWSFPDHGNWATHNSKYRGNWSPHVPRNLIARYSKTNDLVLDQFMGSGTTLIEAQLAGRTVIGVDINPKAIAITKAKLNFQSPSQTKIYLHKGDACQLDFIPNQAIDFICSHPPYANIIKYSKGIAQDLSQLDPQAFMRQLPQIASESYRILKANKFCAMMIGDVRKNRRLYPLGFELMQAFQGVGFELKEIIIKEQHNCRGSKKWQGKTLPFLLLAHEYIFIFKKSG